MEEEEKKWLMNVLENPMKKFDSDKYSEIMRKL